MPRDGRVADILSSATGPCEVKEYDARVRGPSYFEAAFRLGE